MGRVRYSASEKEVRGLDISIGDPCLYGFPCQLGDLELDWPAGLLLHDHGARRYLSTVGDVRHRQLYQVASAELGIDREIEESKITELVAKL